MTTVVDLKSEFKKRTKDIKDIINDGLKCKYKAYPIEDPKLTSSIYEVCTRLNATYDEINNELKRISDEPKSKSKELRLSYVDIKFTKLMDILYSRVTKSPFKPVFLDNTKYGIIDLVSIATRLISLDMKSQNGCITLCREFVELINQPSINDPKFTYNDLIKKRVIECLEKNKQSKKSPLFIINPNDMYDIKVNFGSLRIITSLFAVKGISISNPDIYMDKYVNISNTLKSVQFTLNSK